MRFDSFKIIIHKVWFFLVRESRSFFAVCCCVCVPEGPLGFPVQFGSLLFLVQPSVLLPSLLPLLHLLGRQPAVSKDATASRTQSGSDVAECQTEEQHTTNDTNHQVTQRPLQNYYWARGIIG